MTIISNYDQCTGCDTKTEYKIGLKINEDKTDNESWQKIREQKYKSRELYVWTRWKIKYLGIILSSSGKRNTEARKNCKLSLLCEQKIVKQQYSDKINQIENV